MRDKSSFGWILSRSLDTITPEMALSWSFKTLAYFAVVFAISDLHGTRYKSRLNSVTATDGKDSNRPEVRIPQGVLRGMNMISRRNRSIFGFEGVPYAKPPLGELRFKSPVAPEPWNGTFDASRRAPWCPQIVATGQFVGEEDCLVLNVFTPRLPQSKNSTLLPVMVYIFGGAHFRGTIDSERFGPEYLLDKDVLLVFPNYRLGALGFLSTGDEVAPGNFGLKDLVQALEWTRDNIQYFGGDPNRVTLFGGSSGAIMVHLLSLSNSTNGLFHKYITQSGSALSLSSVQPSIISKNRAFEVGKELGCPTNSSAILIDCLRGLTVLQLVNTTLPFKKWKFTKTYMWMPTVEPHVEGAFLTQNPVELVTSGKGRDLPWLSGFNREEGLNFAVGFYSHPDSAQKFFDSIDSALAKELAYDVQVKNKEYWTSSLKKYYLNDLTASRNVCSYTKTALACKIEHFSFAHELTSLYRTSLEWSISRSTSFENRTFRTGKKVNFMVDLGMKTIALSHVRGERNQTKVAITQAQGLRPPLLRNLTHLYGDIMLICPMFMAQQLHLAFAEQPQYLYSFEYEGTLKYSYNFSGGDVKNYGVTHGDDILYLFRSRHPYFGPPEYQHNENDWKMVDIMVELWTSFATTGTPTTSMFNGTKIWEPFSSRNNYLQIGNGPELTLENKNDFLAARMQFCKDLYANTTWA
ncbi:juvenile hormone esterase-like [Diprion similis]|uniref:juvenile hormone esterase-like n=1 Tax=Diprion similis TaxID=362088 RepID=UPI001EF8A486|nr:juvenile hormone esterase-like [Diprion similis]